MALYFAGSTGNYAEITNGYGNTLSNTSGTISFWLKPTYDLGIAIATKGASLGGLFVEMNTSAGGMYVGVNGYELVSDSNFIADTWVHIAVGGNGTTNITQGRMAVNGTVVYAHGAQGKWLTSAAANLYLGRFDSAGYSYLGWVADIRVWNRRLTEAEMIAVYCNQDVTSGLVERWPLTESSGSTITGTIGGNNGTITGTPVWGGTAIPYGTPVSSGSVRIPNINGGADQ